jgi:hypothetical protein
MNKPTIRRREDYIYVLADGNGDEVLITDAQAEWLADALHHCLYGTVIPTFGQQEANSDLSMCDGIQLVSNGATIQIVVSNTWFVPSHDNLLTGTLRGQDAVVVIDDNEVQLLLASLTEALP